MTDEQIERALEALCDRCGASSGQECVGVDGTPLLETAGIPVHELRGME